MFVPQEALNQAHLTSDMCQRGYERIQHRLVVPDMEERMGRVFFGVWDTDDGSAIFQLLGTYFFVL